MSKDMARPDHFRCPSCDTDLQMEASAVLPAQTDLTLSLSITPGQLVMAKSVAGTIEHFAAMQEAIAKSLDVDASVFIAGLSYVDDRIDVTFRIVNSVRGRVEQGDLFDTTGARAEMEGE